jgi:Lrp/AsnC family leucine-responsive transcriptional regulator
MRALDDVDLQILEALQQDGRLSNTDLARRVGLTATPCLERVKRLERDGVIAGYVALINPKAVERSLLVYIEVTTESAALADNERFKAAVERLPEVLDCHMVGGGFDFLLRARLKDMDAYRIFYSTALAELPGVRETRTYFVIDEFKSTTALELRRGRDMP